MKPAEHIGFLRRVSTGGVDDAGFGPGAVNIKDGMSVADSGYDTVDSNGRVYNYGFGLCPVVSLESEVRPEDFE